MDTILGLAAAILFGASDFGGGLMSRRFGSLAVATVGAAASATVAWGALALSHSPSPSAAAVLWALAAGVGGGVGTLLLYRGLARGRMSVVGPVSAVAAAILPIAAGLALGQAAPRPLAALGVILGVPAIALVASGGSDGSTRSLQGLLDGLGAGAAFGVMFLGLAQAGGDAGLWPVAWEQTASLAVVLVAALASRESLRPVLRRPAPVALVGISGMAATLLYYLATLSGVVAAAVVLTSLYPAVTVLLARLVADEKFARAQRVGLTLSAFTVVAVALH